MEIKVHPLHQRNIDDVLRIQRAAYAENYLEDAESFIAKIDASPTTSCAAWNGDDMVAYLIALPLSAHSGIDLNEADVPAVSVSHATMMYIHDLAVHPDARGRGLAGHLLQWLADRVIDSSISEWRLVSVQGSQDFWAKHGFVVSPDPVPNGYGPEAVLMLRR